MVAIKDVSTSWEYHDDDKDYHHEDQSRARKVEHVFFTINDAYC